MNQNQYQDTLKQKESVCKKDVKMAFRILFK